MRYVDRHIGELRLVRNKAYEGDKLVAVCKSARNAEKNLSH